MSNELSGDRSKPHRFSFDEFVIDATDRQLWRNGERLSLNTRYFDALLLLIEESGQLVAKDRFFEVVWDDVVVSDSALSQCIKEVRKLLGDNAATPRYIQTVPRYGYRFIGTVVSLNSGGTPGESDELVPLQNAASPTRSNHSTALHSAPIESRPWHHGAWILGWGTLGGVVSGLLSGMFYGFGLAGAESGPGTISTLLVLISLTSLAGLIGGFGISLGLAIAPFVARFKPRTNTLFRIITPTISGFLIGSVANLLGLDAFNLLFGHAPTGITGGFEGASLGAAVSLGAGVGRRIRHRSTSLSIATYEWMETLSAGFFGAIGGGLIALFGGHLMGGSLNLLASSFSHSRLQLEIFGSFFGELHFGKATQIALASFEGLLFGMCVVGVLSLGMRFTNHR